jgi:hypothetical protein
MASMLPTEIKGWKKDATIAAIVRATFPKYNKQKVYIEARETVTLHDLNWGGGTRNEYRACTLNGVATGNLARWNQVAPWNNTAEGMTVPVPAGVVVVRGGHFCGKESSLCIIVNPADMPKYLPAA